MGREEYRWGLPGIQSSFLLNASKFLRGASGGVSSGSSRSPSRHLTRSPKECFGNRDHLDHLSSLMGWMRIRMEGE